MSTPTSQPLLSGLIPSAPARSGGRCCGGCAPIAVFLLAILCAGSLIALRCGFGPKEDAGRVVVEFLEKNSKEEMKAYAARVTASEVLHAAVKNSGTTTPQSVVDDLQDRLARNTEVKVSGPRLTITVYERFKSPAALAICLADALDEDVKALTEERSRRTTQNLEAQTKVLAEVVEKRRLEMMDLIKKYNVAPGETALTDALAAEVTSRLAKAKADLIAVESRMILTKDDLVEQDTLSSTRSSLQATIDGYTAAAVQNVENVNTRLATTATVEDARRLYESYRQLLLKLQAEHHERQVREGEVLRPLRVLDQARAIQAPDRRFHRRLQATAVISGILLAASLLTSLTRFLRRI